MLTFSLITLYLLSNLHCAMMCGPLVALLGKHPNKGLYFVGRILIFTAAGLVAGELGTLITVEVWHLGALLSILLGFWILCLSGAKLLHFNLVHFQRLASVHGQFVGFLAKRLDSPHPFAPFFFGLGTILLPCGQSVMVLSAIALVGSGPIGAFHGALFAILTSPSLVAAMQLKRLFRKEPKRLFAALGLLVGLLAILRGVATFNLIPHVSHLW